MRLKDDEGAAIGNRPYQVHCANGEVVKGTLDGNGQANVEDLPPGRTKVSYNVREQRQ